MKQPVDPVDGWLVNKHNVNTDVCMHDGPYLPSWKYDITLLLLTREDLCRQTVMFTFCLVCFWLAHFVWVTTTTTFTSLLLYIPTLFAAGQFAMFLKQNKFCFNIEFYDSKWRYSHQQCDQTGQFIGLWATFKSLWQQLICPNLPRS